MSGSAETGTATAIVIVVSTIAVATGASKRRLRLGDVMLDTELAQTFLNSKIEGVTGDPGGRADGDGEGDRHVGSLACKRKDRDLEYVASLIGRHAVDRDC